MRQKRVSGGQKISGNLSAAAISQLPRLIENDQMRELNKPGGPIPTVDGPGLFVHAKATSELATGEWTYLNRPLFPSIVSSTDVKESTWFNQSELLEAATPDALGLQGGGQYVKQLLPAMAIEPRRAGELTRYQIGGLARTRIQFPEGALATSNLYRTAYIGTNSIPMATDTDAGELDIIWHKEIDSENRIHAAIVRFPTGPRPPRLSQWTARVPGVTYNGGTAAPDFWSKDVGGGLNTYLGVETSAGNLKILRGGEYHVSIGLYLASYSWTNRASRSGRVTAQLTGGIWAGVGKVVANAKAVDASGDPLTDEIIGTATRVINVDAGDTISVQVTADIGAAEVKVQTTIEGPYNNHYPEGSAYY